MPRTRPAYPPEFRRQMVELVRSGRYGSELAREFECSAETLRKRVRRAEAFPRTFKRDCARLGPSPDTGTELGQLGGWFC